MLDHSPKICYKKDTLILEFFLGSSVVEQTAVNRSVAGSNPARGAIPYDLWFFQKYRTGNVESNAGFGPSASSSKIRNLSFCVLQRFQNF